MGLQILIACVKNCSHVYEMTGSHCDISLSNVSALETKAVFVSGMSTQRDCNWEYSMTGSLRPFSEEAPILNLFHDYACSKIVIPGNGFLL